MKKTHIVLLVLVVVAIAAISATFINFSTYVTFTSAAQTPGKSYHVIAHFDKQRGIKYDPKVNANEFTFYAKDKADTMRKVVFIKGAPPRDIDKSEQLVMNGFIKDSVFVCNSIQMKCPSKYKKDMVIGDGA